MVPRRTPRRRARTPDGWRAPRRQPRRDTAGRCRRVDARARARHRPPRLRAAPLDVARSAVPGDVPRPQRRCRGQPRQRPAPARRRRPARVGVPGRDQRNYQAVLAAVPVAAVRARRLHRGRDASRRPGAAGRRNRHRRDDAGAVHDRPRPRRADPGHRQRPALRSRRSGPLACQNQGLRPTAGRARRAGRAGRLQPSGRRRRVRRGPPPPPGRAQPQDAAANASRMA